MKLPSGQRTVSAATADGAPMNRSRLEPQSAQAQDARERYLGQHNPNLLRDRLANERTFLAWLRTGIAVTSLGFVVARFDIFLQELADATRETNAALGGSKAAIPIGVILVLSGPAIITLAAARYLRTEQALLAGRSDPRRLVQSIVIGITAGALIAGVGLALHILATWPR